MSEEYRICPICGYAWLGGMCKHTYKQIFTYATALRKQLEVAMKAMDKIPEQINKLHHTWEVADNVFLTLGEIANIVREAKAKIDKIGGEKCSG
jgi:hypothetical protein